MSEFIVILCFAVLVVLASCDVGRNEIRQEALKRGYASYNPTNGVWQWKESK